MVETWEATRRGPCRRRAVSAAVRHGRRRLGHGHGGSRRHRRLAARDGDPAFNEAKLVTARFYADNILAQAEGLAAQIMRGGESLLALPAELF